jgi:hypothetical protein
MLATPDGEWVFPQTPEIFGALGDPNPDYDAEAFAGKKSGFHQVPTVWAIDRRD